MGTPSIDGARIDAKFIVKILNTLDAAAAAIPNAEHALNLTWTPGSGTTSGKADRAIGDLGRILTTGANEVIDVYDFAGFNIGAGAGLDALGQSVTLAEIAGLIVRNQSGSDEDLLVGGEGTTAAWSSLFNGNDDAEFTLQPGDWFLFASPIADPALDVTDTSNHLLKMLAGGGGSVGVIYDIIFLGRDT